MSTSDRFVTLDGMRGVAALIVALLHVSRMLDRDFAPHANLAVDFFFVLSGFVIAHAYDERLGRSMSPLEFAKRRLIRLHPLIILGAAVTLVTLLARSVAHGATDLLAILWSGIAAILLIPYHQLDPTEAFPLNGPTWSLFAEYAVNILFAFIAVSLTHARLRLLLLAGIVMLFGLVALHGTVGDVWRTDTIFLSLLRVVYPFFVGVLINRLYRSGQIKPPRLPAWVPMAGLVAVLLAPSTRLDIAFELTMIIVVFPLLVIGGINDQAGARATELMLWGGAMSYPLYILHYPVGKAVGPLIVKLMPDSWAMASIGMILSLVVIASWAALRYFDEPVRAALASSLRSHGRARQLA